MQETRSRLMSLARDLLPADLLPDFEASLSTPQLGPHHNEGPFMDSHLEAMLRTLDDVSRFRFASGVPHEAAAVMDSVVMVHRNDAVLHILLHDIEKQSCLTLVFADGHEEERASLEGLPVESAEAWSAYCAEHGVVQVSYYHGDGESKRSHGKAAAERLRAHGGFSELLLRGIETHEIATVFGDRDGVNIPLFEENFGDLNAAEIAYVLLANYLDQMASLGADGQPDIGDFVWLAKTWLAWRDLEHLKRRLAELDRLDQHKLSQILGKLRNDKDAFQAESVDVAFERILKEVKLPEVTADQVREALAPAMAEGLPADIAEAIVAEMTSDGKVSSETGKRLGKFNKTVRPALAKLAK